MVYLFFFFVKIKWIVLIDFCVGVIVICVEVVLEYGMVMIWDVDVLIWVVF